MDRSARRRLLLGAGLLALLSGSAAADTAFTSFAYSATGGTATRTDPNRWADLINAKEFGAVGDNSHDDTANIQAAIDYAYAHSHQGVYLPAGLYKTSGPLFLDPPGNLRNSLTTGLISNFSLALVGDEGTGGYENFGSVILPTSASFVALWVGPGEGMHVRNISIVGPNAAVGQAVLLPSTGCGIAVACAAGGASRTFIEQCAALRYYNGIAVGFNGLNVLGDSNTIVKCFVDNCYYGIRFLQAENFINSLYDCNITNCNFAVVAPGKVMVDVLGGNYSSSGNPSAIFTIGSVSALSTFTDTIAGNSFTNYQFTAVVSSPDTLMNGAGYDSCAIVTTKFGVVPVACVSFNTGTNTATFRLQSYWRWCMFGASYDVAGSSNLQAQLQAATTLYACVKSTVFSGGIFNVKGIHLESEGSLTTFCYVSQSQEVTIERCFINYDPSGAANIGGGGGTQAIWYCQQAWPWLVNEAGKLRFADNFVNANQPTEAVTIDVAAYSRTIFENNDLWSPNVRYLSPDNNVTGTGATAETKVYGVGEWDISPWPSHASMGSNGFFNNWTHNFSINQSPMRGWRPDFKIKPQFTPAQVTTLAGTLPAIGGYPLMCGGTVYDIFDPTGANAKLWCRSAHSYYSYGQNLTASAGNGQISGLSWSVLGNSAVVYFDTTSLDWLFPGLKITLSINSVNYALMVTEVHKTLGYIVTTRISENQVVNAETKTTTFTGTTITQEAYAITQYP